jgi:hypothetical protein
VAGTQRRAAIGSSHAEHFSAVHSTGACVPTTAQGGRSVGGLLYLADVQPCSLQVLVVLVVLDLPLTRSFHVLRSSAAFLVSVGFLVVSLPPAVRGFRPVLARDWHDQLGSSVARPSG